MRAGEERVLAVGLLPAAPARVAEDVDVRRPERRAPGRGCACRAAPTRVFFARASSEIAVATRSMRSPSHVAARPIACGNTVARPARATPCSASFHQGNFGMPSRSTGAARSIISETFSSSVSAADEVVDALLDRQLRVAERQVGTGPGRARRSGTRRTARRASGGDEGERAARQQGVASMAATSARPRALRVNEAGARADAGERAVPAALRDDARLERGSRATRRGCRPAAAGRGRCSRSG